MTVNQKKSIIAFFISKYNAKAYEHLGYYKSVSAALDDMSLRITGLNIKPNAYIKQRRDEFDVFFDNGRAGYRKREPSKQVLDMYQRWNVLSFDELLAIAKEILVGDFDKRDIINLSSHESISEYDIEVYLNFEDDTADIKKRVKAVLERSYSKKKIDLLKRLYGYKCQICGKNIGDEYDTNIAEAHHIKFFSESIDNSSDNLLILCPNHHTMIHNLKPKFDYDNLQYVYPNGKVDKLILNLHLPYGKYQN